MGFGTTLFKAIDQSDEQVLDGLSVDEWRWNREYGPRTARMCGGDYQHTFEDQQIEVDEHGNATVTDTTGKECEISFECVERRPLAQGDVA